MGTDHPQRTLTLIQVPENVDHWKRAWLIREPRTAPLFLGFLGNLIEFDGFHYKVLPSSLSLPATVPDEESLQEAMGRILHAHATQRAEGVLAGPLLKAAKDALSKLPYQNSLWILNATDEELESWAMTLAAKPS